jgi:hypothetical protein
MDLPTTAQVEESLKYTIDGASKAGVPREHYERVQTWAKGFEVLIRAYDQGGLPQLEKVFLANFEGIAKHIDAAKAATAATSPAATSPTTSVTKPPTPGTPTKPPTPKK